MPAESTLELSRAVRAALDSPTNSPYGRIVAVVGPNGVGKSRLLRDLREGLNGNGIACFLLPAIRRIAPSHVPPPHIEVGSVEESASRVLDYLLAPPTQPNVTTARVVNLQVSIENALMAMLASFQRSRANKLSRYKDALFEHEMTKNGEKPTLVLENIAPILNTIGAILGYDVEYDASISDTPDLRRLTFKKNGSLFGIDGLSDGEIQMFMVSILLLHQENTDKKFVLLADEPELYLNEARAILMWEKIEERFPAAVFVYATHNLNFATRPSVSTTYILNSPEKLEIIDRTMPLPRDMVRDIVGARIQLARSTSPIIFCEDKLSKIFLSDLFIGESVEIVAVTNDQSVVSAVSSEKQWEAVRSKGIKCCGIIDRDMRDDEEVAKLEKKCVFCLPVNEVESVILVPKIAVTSLSKSAGIPVTTEQYVAALVEMARKRLHGTLGKLASHLERWYSPSIKWECSGYNRVECCVSPPENLKEKFIERSNEIFKCINDADVEGILRMFKGKDLYKELRGWSRSTINVHIPPNPEQRYNDTRNEVITQLSNVYMFRELKTRVLRWLATSAG